MPTQLTLRVAALGSCLLALPACEAIAGIEDKQLEPPANSLPDASPDAPVDAASEPSHDVINDSPPDALDESDATADTELPYPARPPERPDPADAGSDGDAAPGRILTFAVTRPLFGSIDPGSDIRTFEAWRQFGFDIDGFCTTAKQSQDDNSGVCKKPPLSTMLSQEDAYDCRDNTVGHLVADVLQFSVMDFERTVHVRIRSGDAQTLIIQLHDVGDGPDDPYVPARVYVSAPTPFPPLWDGTDVLPVDVDSVDGDVEHPKYTFATGYIRDNVWVSGDFNDEATVIPLMLLDEVVEVAAETATIVIRLTADNTTAIDGMFSAVLDLGLLAPLLNRGVLEATACDQSLADLAVNGYFLPSRDLVAGSPSFADPTAVCDRQSLGLRLELVEVLPPLEAVQVPPQPSACD